MEDRKLVMEMLTHGYSFVKPVIQIDGRSASTIIVQNPALNKPGAHLLISAQSEPTTIGAAARG
jgi:hypothetical protein